MCVAWNTQVMMLMPKMILFSSYSSSSSSSSPSFCRRKWKKFSPVFFSWLGLLFFVTPLDDLCPTCFPWPVVCLLCVKHASENDKKRKLIRKPRHDTEDGGGDERKRINNKWIRNCEWKTTKRCENRNKEQV